jgi:FkbH-like protein
VSRDRFFFVADFNIDTLARLIANTAIPGADTRIADSGHVMNALAAGAPGPEWNAVVWTRPESVSQQLARAMTFDAVDPVEALDETRAFAAAVSQFAGGTRTTFVPAWVLPPGFRGYGPLDRRPGLGVAALLERMNLTLAESLLPMSNVFVLDSARWFASVGQRGWSDKQWYASKSPFTSALLELAANEIAAAISGQEGQSRRLIILDLDDVLWGGLVGEVGWQSLSLGGHDHVGEAFLDFQRALKALTRRGIQLAIVSKNDEATALEAIDKHPEMILRRSDFAGWRINWDDKAANVEALLGELGLGAASAVFIDDSAIERARVADAVTGVLVPDWPADPASFRAALYGLRCFDTPAVTVEDRERTSMYAAERARRSAANAAGNFEQWFERLGVTVAVEPLNSANLERAAQLFNKTNQMNLATRRLSATELMQWASAEHRALLTFRVADRFGDSGLTGIIGLERDGAIARLTDFLISCRVLGRRVEQTLLHVAVERARAAGASQLVADFVPTARNRPCLDFFRQSHLHAVGEHRFTWDLSRPYDCPRFVTLRDQNAVSTAGNQ